METVTISLDELASKYNCRFDRKRGCLVSLDYPDIIYDPNRGEWVSIKQKNLALTSIAGILGAVAALAYAGIKADSTPVPKANAFTADSDKSSLVVPNPYPEPRYPTPTPEPSPTPAPVSEEEADFSKCEVSPKFPEKVFRWCGLITHYANKRGLPPDLVAALILQESGGDPTIPSHSGAIGLMQVMPRDGIAASFMCINGPCFANRPSIAELEDPQFNVSYGTKMLAGLVQKRGDIRSALKSYGPMDVGWSYADTVIAIWKRFGGESSILDPEQLVQNVTIATAGDPEIEAFMGQLPERITTEDEYYRLVLMDQLTDSMF